MSQQSIRIVGLQRVLRDLRATPEQVRKAGRSSVNKVVRRARNLAIDIVKRESSLRPSAIRKRLRLVLAKQGEVSAEIMGDPNRIVLKEYKPRFRRQARFRTRVAVYADISLRRGVQLVSRRTFRSPGKTKAIFYRKVGVSRYPVNTATGPSVGHFIPDIYTRTQAQISQDLRTEFLSAIRRIMNPGGGNAR